MAWTKNDWNNRTTYPTTALRRARLIEHIEEITNKIYVSTTSGDNSVNSANIVEYLKVRERDLAALDQEIGDTISASSPAQRSRFVRAVPR